MHILSLDCYIRCSQPHGPIGAEPLTFGHRVQRRVGWAQRWLVASLAALSCAGLFAQTSDSEALAAQLNQLTEITAVSQDQRTNVRLRFRGPLSHVPLHFSIANNSTVVVDLEGIEDLDGRNFPVAPSEMVRSVRVVQSAGRTRVVISMKQLNGYELKTEGTSILLVFNPPPLTDTSVAPIQVEAPVLDGSHSLRAVRNVDFRRGENGTAKVVVELPSPENSADIRSQGRSLWIEIDEALVPDSLRRRMDVTDFGTPVSSVITSQRGRRAMIQVVSNGNWEHVGYQTGRQLVVEISPKRNNEELPTSQRIYKGEALSLNFQSIDVRALLQVFADFSGFNVVVSDSVSGNITLRLKDVPWDQALDVVLQNRGLGMKRIGNVMTIAPKDELTARAKAEAETLQVSQDNEGLATEAFQLNWTKASDVAAQITAMGDSTAKSSSAAGGRSGGLAVLGPRGSVSAEPRTNQLFVSDVRANLDRVAQLVRRMDIPVKQVMIEARIVEASDTFSKSIGVKLGGFYSGRNARVGSSYNDVTSSTQSNSSSNTAVNLPAAGEGGFEAASYAVSLFNSAGTRALNVEISALESDGKGKVLANPRVVTADQSKASIEQGTEIPYQTATSSGATAIAFRKANLSLEVTPQITPDGSVIMELAVNKDSVGQETANGLAINTKQIKTKVLVENGGTIMMGGIFEITDNKDESRVPLLGELPVIGALFRNRTSSINKQEILIFITPRVISDPQTMN